MFEQILEKKKQPAVADFVPELDQISFTEQCLALVQEC